jgi:hypothetical protein
MHKLGKSFLSSSIAVLLAISTVSPAQAQRPFELDSSNIQPNQIKVSFTEEIGTNSGRVVTIRANGNQYDCLGGFDAGFCRISPDREFGANTIFPVCKEQSSENCVVGLSAKLAGDEYEADFLKYAGGQAAPAIPKLGLYEGAQISLWSIPGLVHQGGTDTYALNFSTMAQYSHDKKRFDNRGVNVSLIPYVLETDPSFRPPNWGSWEDPVTKKVGVGLDGTPNSVWSSAGEAGRVAGFPVGVDFKIEARAPSSVTGWFRGRLQDPEISMTRFSATNNLLTVAAEPVQVARVSTILDKASAPARLLSMLSNYAVSGNPGENEHKLLPATAAGNPDSYAILRKLRATVKDTAAGISSLWNFSSVPFDGSNPCLQGTNRVLGMATTNATIFDGTSPSFSKGFLSYKLAGMHYLQDGVTESMGSYDLLIRSDVARCLYGFTRAPVSATITVSGEGDRSIATTIVSEKNGWLKLAAYGFTFSEKTIMVKLTQKKSKTITCTAPNKKSVRITATTPKCPKGFKKR